MIFLLFLLSSVCSVNLAAMDYSHLPWISGFHGAELDIVKKFLPKNPVILEAGARRGEDTVVFIKKWPRATIYAFEPCPQYYEQLKHVTSGISNIHIFPIGLFTTSGSYIFHVSEAWDGASSLLADNHIPNGLDYNDHQIQVICKNLDEWALENNVKKIDYMWLDMEGAELYVLKSAPNILSTVKVISCELNFVEYRKGMTLFQDIYDFLLINNFELHAIWGTLGQATGVFVKSAL